MRQTDVLLIPLDHGIDIACLFQPYMQNLIEKVYFISSQTTNHQGFMADLELRDGTVPEVCVSQFHSLAHISDCRLQHSML